MTDKTIAIEILKQLGGQKFIVMTGARNFYAFNSGMGFKVSGTMTKKRINWIKIKLNSLDTYDIEFISCWGDKLKLVDKANGVYCDMLRGIIADRTGLALSL